MKDMEAILDEISNIEAGISAAETEKSNLFKDAASHAPFKVGDTLEVTGHGHKGKRMEISKIAFKLSSGYHDPYFSDPSWVAYGKVFKNDGTLGKNDGVHVLEYKAPSGGDA